MSSSVNLVGWHDVDTCHRWEMATPQLPTPQGNNQIWYANMEAAVFQWCYLSCSVMTPCNDDLSLLFVMCSIFIYDQASFFTVLLWIYHPFFCAISATNEKIKKRNILCAESYIFTRRLAKESRSKQGCTECSISFCMLGALSANPLVSVWLVCVWHLCPRSFSKGKPSYSRGDRPPLARKALQEKKKKAFVQIVLETEHSLGCV